jgi:hypothetical protein
MMLPPIVFVADNSVHFAFESLVQELELLPLLFIPFNLSYLLSILVVCIYALQPRKIRGDACQSVVGREPSQDTSTIHVIEQTQWLLVL